MMRTLGKYLFWGGFWWFIASWAITLAWSAIESMTGTPWPFGDLLGGVVYFGLGVLSWPTMAVGLVLSLASNLWSARKL